MQVDFEFYGDEEFEKVLQRMPLEIQLFVARYGCLAMGRVIAREARRLVPVDTGALRKSIRARTVRERFRGRKIPSAAGVFVGGTGAAHANLVEHGTVKTSAKPFLRPAIQRNTSEQHQAFVRESKKRLSLVVASLASTTRVDRRTVLGRALRAFDR